MSRFKIVFLLSLVILLEGSSQMLLSQNEQIRKIDSRLELFIDDFLIAQFEQTALKLHTPFILPNSPDAATGAYVTIIQDGELFRRYQREIRASYSGERYDGNPGEMVCYYESNDGINWTKPSLKLIEIDGSLDNNAIIAEAPYCHNFSPVLDRKPGIPQSERFKAFSGTHPGGGLIPWTSADGIHWKKLSEKPVITSEDFAFDSQNIAFWSEHEKCYVCYFRSWQTPHGRLRTISRTTSEDFIHWTKPVAMEPNFPGEHLYASAIHPYFRAPHIYISTPTRFLPDRGNSTDIMFMTSRGGNRFNRYFKEAFIRPGLNPRHWGNRSNYAVLNIIPTSPTEMSLFLCSGHAKSRQCVLRTDGFASVHATEIPGTMLTHPLIFRGDSLVLNYSTSAAGEILVELQNQQGEPIPGFTKADCQPIIGDEIERVVKWNTDKKLSELAQKPVLLKFFLKEADLFSIQFCEQ